MKYKLKIGVYALLMVIGAISILSFSKQSFSISGSTDVPVKGYMWTDNIGWMILSSKICDTNNNGQYDSGDVAPSGCPTSGTAVAFGVLHDTITGNLSGYAWSDHVGWISFNETSGCPSGTCQPKIVSDKIQGWVKAKTADGNGWDGWISLGKQSGDTITYGPTRTGDDFFGYPWGSEVVGWVESRMTVTEDLLVASTTCGTAHSQPSATPPSDNLCVVGANPSSFTTGATEYTWTCTVLGLSQDSCSAPRVGIPADGSCSTSSANSCDIGIVTSGSQGETETEYQWTCDGVNGGDTSSICSYPKTSDTCNIEISSYRLSPSVVKTPDDQCKLTSLSVVNQTSGDPAACAPIFCRVGSRPPFLVTPGSSIDVVNVPIGTHSITCENGTYSASAMPPAKCRLNPNYGEF